MSEQKIDLKSGLEALLKIVSYNIRGGITVIREHIHHVSANTLGWIGIIIIHLSTIPTLLAMLTGLTEKTPPVDMVLATWVGLFLFFIKSVIERNVLNIVTVGLGFAVQAGIMALILFK